MPLGYFTDSTPLTPLRDPFNVLVDGINNVASTREIQTFRWADATERAAQTGMVAGDRGYQIDTGLDYIYTGSAWGINTGGLILVQTGTFTAVSSLTLDGIFTSAFSSYRVSLRMSRSASLSVGAALRASGSTISGANYGYQQLFGNSTSATAASVSGANSWAGPAITGTGSADVFCELTISSPALAERTIALLRQAASGQLVQNNSLYYDATTAADGIIFNTTTGTMTGRYTVHGYTL